MAHGPKKKPLDFSGSPITLRYVWSWGKATFRLQLAAWEIGHRFNGNSFATSAVFAPPFRLAASVLWCWSWKKEGKQLKWSLQAFRLYIVSSPCTQLPGPVHTARLGWVCFFSTFSLGLCFACLFVLFGLFVSPFFCVSLGSWVISLTVFGASVLNKPPRALATSTIM